jgi:hypothetical protein
MNLVAQFCFNEKEQHEEQLRCDCTNTVARSQEDLPAGFGKKFG